MDQQEALSTPKTYFELICKVGSKGPYQRNVFLTFALNWFVSAFLLMGTSFLFLNPKFDCQSHGIQTDNCQKTICAMDSSEWNKYLEEPEVHSLATQFGPYLCNDLQELNASRMTLYIGNLIGYIVFLFITDNFGRKLSLIITWATTMTGLFLLCISWNMTVALIGLFIAGSGCQAVLRINMAYLSEAVDYYARQNYSIALQMAFGFAGVLVGVFYWIIRDWRYVTIFFCGVLGLIVLFLFIFYVEETPKFLITKKGVEKSIKALNRIGRINLGKSDLITEEDIKRVYQNQGCGSPEKQSMIAPWHLLTYKSLRTNTICCSLIFYLMTYLYFGPIIIVADLGINPFLAQIIISLSQLIAYPFAYWFIQKLPRIKSGVICFIISAVFCGILIFVIPPKDCQGCFQIVLKTALIFASRFTVSFYFAIFFLYIAEIFPQRVRGLGFGVASAFGAIASSSGQFIFEEMQERGINPMIFFTIFSILASIIISFADESLNKPLQTEIKEIQEHKDREQNDQGNGLQPNSSQQSDGKDSHRKTLREQNNKHIEMVENNNKDEEEFNDEIFQIG